MSSTPVGRSRPRQALSPAPDAGPAHPSPGCRRALRGEAGHRGCGSHDDAAAGGVGLARWRARPTAAAFRRAALAEGSGPGGRPSPIGGASGRAAAPRAATRRDPGRPRAAQASSEIQRTTLESVAATPGNGHDGVDHCVHGGDVVTGDEGHDVGGAEQGVTADDPGKAADGPADGPRRRGGDEHVGLDGPRADRSGPRPCLPAPKRLAGGSSRRRRAPGYSAASGTSTSGSRRDRWKIPRAPFRPTVITMLYRKAAKASRSSAPESAARIM